MNASNDILIIKAGSDVHLRNRHHSIFKGAVHKIPKVADGSIVEVQTAKGEFLCFATWNSKAYICGRAISFEKGDPLEVLKRNIESSIALRSRFFGPDDTAVRLVNAEGDGIPGLVLDQYGDVLVVQCTTLGMDMLKPWLIELLKKIRPECRIFEKSTGSARSKEGVEAVEGWLYGGSDFATATSDKGETAVPVTERGLKFLIELSGSQKTGLFIDQREMRSLVRSIAKDKTVLDCCSYVGGFSVSALAGGAKSADAVDYDSAALARAKDHATMNGLDAGKLATYDQDVFEFLRKKPHPHSYDFVILDPPAFAKRSSDIEQAKKAYTDLNRLGMQALPESGGLLLTCSCSYHMDAALFQTVVFHAARQLKKNAKILQRHRYAFDHPVNLFHPEVDYLKSLLLWIE